MLKVLGVASVLALAGVAATPAYADRPTDIQPVSVTQTVSTVADPLAVVAFESPAVTTVAAPEPEAVTEPVAVVPVAPVAPVVASTEAEAVEAPAEAVAVPVAPAQTATPSEPVGGTVTEPEAAPEVTAPAETPAPEVTEESEVQSPITTTDSPEYIEGMSFLRPGEVYGGSYVGDSSAWVAAGNRVVVSPTIRKVDPEQGPLGPTQDVFHVYAQIGNAPTPEDIEAMGNGS